MHQKLTYWDKSTRLVKPLNIPILAKSGCDIVKSCNFVINVGFRWVRLPSNFVLTFVCLDFLSFLSILFNTSLNVRMLESNTEIPYLDEPVKLVLKLHFSTYRTWQKFSGPCRDLVNSQSWRRHCLPLELGPLKCS